MAQLNIDRKWPMRIARAVFAVTLVLGPAQTFGELAVIDGGPRVATVRARTPTSLVVLPRPAVTSLLDRHPPLARAFLAALAAMVRRVDEQACDASLLDLPRRVQKLLASAAATATAQSNPSESGMPTRAARRGDGSGFVPVNLALTQTDLARQVGGSRQQINRILMALEADGSIERLGHRVIGIRPDLLAADI